MLLLMVAAFYFLLIRPAQKKQRAQQEMVGKLAPGTRVMTTAGIYATILHLGDKQAIVEIAPGVEMTLLKQAIMRAVNPDEDEFEYDDDAASDDLEPEASAVEEPTMSFERPDDAR